jgi:hypothetical protein
LITTELVPNLPLPSAPCQQRTNSELSGYIDRRQGRWHDAMRNFGRAVELIRETLIFSLVRDNYYYVRDYGQGKAAFDRVIALEPKNILYRFGALVGSR